MLKDFINHRPRNLLAVYIESQQIEVLRAHRQWRNWEVDSCERIPIPDSEPVYDFLQRQNLRPRGRNATTLLLFLSRSYYTFHREHYPASLREQLEEALNFDWQENTFHEHERTLHFFGPPVPFDRHLSVPIFSMQTDVYEKFYQVLGGAAFQTFTVIPSALVYKAFFPALFSEEDTLPLEIIARIIDPQHLEIHRFYNGALLDSTVIGKNLDNLRLFRENLHCLAEGVCQEDVHIHLMCSEDECDEAKDYGKDWVEEDLPVRVLPLEGNLLSHWINYLFEQDRIRTFDTELVLKPWQVPKVAYPILAAVFIFVVFTLYQVHAVHRLGETGKQLKKEMSQLEAQWKPIEALQNRISKFQQDQKTLSQFNMEGYPTLEILTVLTQVTPDDTWLNYLSLKKGQLILRGESKSAIKYLSELSKVEGLTDVRFASPVTKNPASDQERFNVQVEIDLERMSKSFGSLSLEKGEAGTEAPGTVISPRKMTGPPPGATGDEEQEEDTPEEVQQDQ